MLCCLNPRCPKPINSDSAAVCRGCRRRLVSALRGRYRPLQPIGQGGFGRTYLAEDRDRLNARCVIKQLSPQATGTESTRKATALFTQEAVRLNELGEHPQIPALLAYFEQEGHLYLVQQHIDGVSLAQELNRHGPFDESKIRAVLLDLLPVLQFIHTRQVIHRDITPTNILRRRLDNRLILIDFGVAKQLRIQSGHQPGTQIGTEGYSPIEQLRGGQAYPASDLYSLGATCLHLLTATKPEQLFNPLTGEWLWPAYLARHNRRLTPQLTAILHKLMQDLVRDRYQSAEAVWQDLCHMPQPGPNAPNPSPIVIQPSSPQNPSGPDTADHDTALDVGDTGADRSGIPRSGRARSRRNRSGTSPPAPRTEPPRSPAPPPPPHHPDARCRPLQRRSPYRQ